MPLLEIGAALSGLGSIGKFIFGGSQRDAADENPYQKDPYALKKLATANNLYNARMFGATELERNIATAQANQNEQIQKLSGDGTQALQMAASAQGQANNNYQDLQIKEAQNKYNTLKNLNDSYNTMTENFRLDEDRRNKLLSAGAKNQYDAVNDLGSLGVMLDNLKNGGTSRNQKPSFTPGLSFNAQ